MFPVSCYWFSCCAREGTWGTETSHYPEEQKATLTQVRNRASQAQQETGNEKLETAMFLVSSFWLFVRAEARFAIPIVAASELGPALTDALLAECSRTCLERPAIDGESPVGETFSKYSLVFPLCGKKYDRTREIRSEECVSASERNGGSSPKATYSP